MNSPTFLWCAILVAACANVTAPTPQQTEGLATARALLAENPHEALRITDQLLKEEPNWREARLLAAEGSHLLAKQDTSGRPDVFLQDAVSNLEKALADTSQPAEPTTWRMLADCRFELGEFAGASEAALHAAESFAALRTGAGRRAAAEAVLLAGKALSRSFAVAREEELKTGKPDYRGLVVPSKETAALAVNAVSRFESVRGEFPGEACTQIAVIHQWLGQGEAAASELERGIRSSPTENIVHDAFLAWMTERGQHDAMVGAYSQFVRESPAVPLLRWHQGRALYARADRLRREGNFQGAIAGYDKCKAVFGEYGAMVPSHSDSANQWLALAEMSIARTSIELGDFEGAQQHLFAAVQCSPAAVEYVDGKPVLTDSFGSHFTGVVFALGRALSEGGPDALQKTLAFNSAVIERHPDRWGFVYNNAALAARDLGVKLADDGKAAEAKELWERSFRWYEKAVALSPDDPRIVNDCGLMLIYHLDRDFDRAREMFDRAIAVGQPQLDAMPPTAEPRERELLEEAIGDAWQNIAVLLRKHLHKPFADYQPFCEQAVRYYPYERRTAAALLRSNGTDDGEALATAVAAPQGSAAEALAKVMPQVKGKADEADFDAALTVLDGIAKECKEHAPYHALRGELTLKLAAKNRDEGKKGVEFLYTDAVAALKKAVALDSEPAATRLLLCQAMYDSNDLEGAANTASSLLLHLQSQGGGKPEMVEAVHTLRANGGARAYAAQKGEQKDNQELLTAARTSFRLLEKQGKLDAALLALWSTTEQWAGAPAEAVSVYARAAQKSPDDQALQGALVDTAAAQSQLPLAIESLHKRSDATGLWWLGKARYLLAASEREAGKTEQALKSLDAAKKEFADSMKKNAAYRESCEQWIAMCLGKKGNIAFRADDLGNAETWLLEAVRLRPANIGDDLGLAETTKLGILRVADAHFQKKDLGKAEAIYRAASDAANADLDLLNNSGLFARDFGNELERNGKMKEATAMYEQSYKAYRRALELDAANVRLRNDCALIAIYHLERDWDLCKQMLDAAIADGQKQLRDAPPDDAQDKQNLDEAVGDCYENLALWHLKHSKDGAAAKAAAEKSQNHHPGARRPGARRHLQAAERLLQGK